jgi:hypothetical protein
VTGVTSEKKRGFGEAGTAEKNVKTQNAERAMVTRIESGVSKVVSGRWHDTASRLCHGFVTALRIAEPR